MVTIRIENMNCGGCAKGVTATLKAVSPTAEIRVDLERHEVTVEAPDAAPLVAALMADGWKAAAVAG
jgi:copper chaperone